MRNKEKSWLFRVHYEIATRNRPRVILLCLERLAKVWGLRWD